MRMVAGRYYLGPMARERLEEHFTAWYEAADTVVYTPNIDEMYAAGLNVVVYNVTHPSRNELTFEVSMAISLELDNGMTNDDANSIERARQMMTRAFELIQGEPINGHPMEFR